ncbi:MAG: diaminopimelate decarboxylase [Clostridiales bacterium]|nr:diaminopimelate decarboxylase [Clostridiales bacterium]MCF8021240.1 diaminopimelate decarboxylase [Clostridiales bacterium]
MKLQGTMSTNSEGHLVIGGCDAVQLAKEFKTPLYVIDEEAFRGLCRDYYQSFTKKYGAHVLYASKALFTPSICHIVREEGLGLEVVSGGELYAALKTGFPAIKMYFHGNNKSRDELEMALKVGVGRIVVDNLHELNIISELVNKLNVQVNIDLRLTPGVEAHTHDYIKTGQIDSKFGLVIENGQAMEGIKRALSIKNVDLKGIHCHIGSQIFELESFKHAVDVMLDFTYRVKNETGWAPQEINLGGGLGIYHSEGDEPKPVSSLADMVIESVHEKTSQMGISEPTIVVEPGRSIAGPSGSTLYTIGSVKNIPGIRKYAAVDGGMGDNPRPALYQAAYEGLLANKANAEKNDVASIAGKCCESGDMLIWDLELPEVEPGDILAVSATGAYNFSMSSNYNMLPRPAMVLVSNGKADVIVERETYDDLLKTARIPDRLK